MGMKEWATSPETKAFQEKLKEDRQLILEAWARGNFTSKSLEETCQKNSEHIGMVSAIDEIIAWIDEQKADA